MNETRALVRDEAQAATQATPATQPVSESVVAEPLLRAESQTVATPEPPTGIEPSPSEGALLHFTTTINRRHSLNQRMALIALIEEQEGIVSRSQLLELGFSLGWIRAQLDARRWRRIWPGVLATFTGPVPARARCWAALLRAGPDAVLGAHTALWLAGTIHDPPNVVEVRVPHERRAVAVPGVSIARSRYLDVQRHPSAVPARMTVEHALLDAASRFSRPDAAIGLILTALNGRTTTRSRIAAAARELPRLRHRRVITELVAPDADQVASLLEHRYAVEVERAHGLPRAQRNRRDQLGRSVRYRDNRYRKFHLQVELDGEAYHPASMRWRDRLTDNDYLLRDGDVTLRFGWAEVVHHPCEIADRVARGLNAGGWTGVPQRCGPDCAL